MKRKNYILLLFIFFNTFLIGQNNFKLIDSAKNAYADGKFETAIKHYQQILNSDFEAAEIYYNLGNAYYKSNKLTLAIINYERALRLSPGDEEILFNLEIARQYVVDKIEVLPRLFIYDWIDSIINIYSSDNWAFIGISSFVSLLIFLLLFFFTTKVLIKKISFWFSTFLIILVILSFLFSLKQKSDYEKHNTAIIFNSSVTIKSSPDLSGNDLFVLHEGTKVIIIDSVQTWLEIKLPNGNIGWLQQSEVVIL